MSILVWTSLFLCGVGSLLGVLRSIARRAKHIPELRSTSGWFGVWEDGMRYVKDSPGVLSEGYEKVRWNDKDEMVYP